MQLPIANVIIIESILQVVVAVVKSSFFVKAKAAIRKFNF